MEQRAPETTSLLRGTQYSYGWWMRWARRYKATPICITSKAAKMTLFWCFFIGIIYGLASNPSTWILHNIGYEFASLLYFGNAISLCFYPLAGYLADNVVGRYKVIIRSVQIIMVILMVSILPLILLIALVIVGKIDTSVNVAVAFSEIGLLVVIMSSYLAFNIGFIGFNANIIQFGMEQLHDSPADHQSLFIYWYVWIYYLVKLIIVQPWNLMSLSPSTPSDLLFFYAGMSLFGILAVVCLFMIAASLAYGNKAWFLINPSRISPYKLVYTITRFARQHKVPIRRSAFTYCEDEIPTGLDLAKDKYGGPYTTEEVENVKAFYGILKILLSLGPIFFITYAVDPVLYWYIEHLHYLDPFSDYYSRNTKISTIYSYIMDDTTLSSLTIVILIPFYIVALRQFRCRYSPNLFKRIGLGIIFLLMALLSITTLSLLFENNVRYTCFEDYAYFNNNTEVIRWVGDTGSGVCVTELILPALTRFLYGLFNVLLYTALYEFICAQSPPSMKGLLIGLSFAIRGIFQTIGAAFAIYFVTSVFNKHSLIYYGINIALAVVALIIFTCFSRRYKYRQRDEICDIYRYAEEYYSHRNREENLD